MSDQEIGKKMVEESELEYFLCAYEYVTGEKLTIVQFGERPDFVCEREGGLRVGVELTKIVDDWDGAFFDGDDFKAIDRIYELIETKAKKIKDRGWITGPNTILVLQLHGWPLSEIMPFLTDDLQSDFNSYGFVEIWIADYTGLDAYGDIELFGLYPSKWWGYHQRHNP